MSDTLTKGERETLLKMIRQRERVAKTEASARSGHLLAEFEAQLDRKYDYDEDEVWSKATSAAQQVTAEAQRMIDERCRELGIPADFAPGLSVSWYSRGRNALQSERAEMRRLAKRRIEQIENDARLAIEQASLRAQEQLWGTGLTSEAAQAFLGQMPTADSLMPALALEAVQAALSEKKSLTTRRPGQGMIEGDAAVLMDPMEQNDG